MAANDLITVELNYQNKRYNSAYLGLKEFARITKTSLDGLGMPVAIELRRFLKGSMGELASRHSGLYSGENRSKDRPLMRRSGGLYRALTTSYQVRHGSTIQSVEADIGLPKKYVTHETGAIIKAKKGKYLTIPLEAALRPNGTPIKPSARDWDNTFVGRSKKGNLLIFRKTRTGIVPLYALKPMVEIPARLGLVRTMEARLPAMIDRMFESMLDNLISKGL